MANGNSRAARSARAKLQLRDSKGRWIEMGRSRVSWYSTKNKKDMAGTALSTPDGKNAIVLSDDGKKHAVSGRKLTIVEAKTVLPAKGDKSPAPEQSQPKKTPTKTEAPETTPETDDSESEAPEETEAPAEEEPQTEEAPAEEEKKTPTQKAPTLGDDDVRDAILVGNGLMETLEEGRAYKSILTPRYNNAKIKSTKKESEYTNASGETIKTGMKVYDKRTGELLSIARMPKDGEDWGLIGKPQMKPDGMVGAKGIGGKSMDDLTHTAPDSAKWDTETPIDLSKASTLASINQAMEKKYPGLSYKLERFGLKEAKMVTESVDKNLRRYPHAQERLFSVSDRGFPKDSKAGAFVAHPGAGGDDDNYISLHINPNANATRVAIMNANNKREGWAITAAEEDMQGNPFARVVNHEFGHIIEEGIQGTNREKYDQKVILETVEEALEKIYPAPMPIDKKFRSALSEYGTTNSMETVAESVADVIGNGENASGLSKAVTSELARQDPRLQSVFGTPRTVDEIAGVENWKEGDEIPEKISAMKFTAELSEALPEFATIDDGSKYLFKKDGQWRESWMDDRDPGLSYEAAVASLGNEKFVGDLDIDQTKFRAYAKPPAGLSVKISEDSNAVSNQKGEWRIQKNEGAEDGNDGYSNGELLSASDVFYSNRRKDLGVAAADEIVAKDQGGSKDINNLRDDESVVDYEEVMQEKAYAFPDGTGLYTETGEKIAVKDGEEYYDANGKMVGYVPDTVLDTETSKVIISPNSKADFGRPGAEDNAPTAPEPAEDEGVDSPEEAPVESETMNEQMIPGTDIERTEPVALDGEKFAPTRQQQDVIDAVVAGKDTLVQAKAGAGKTTTLEAIARRISDKEVVYIAFNRSVAEEAKNRMPGNVESRTGHSLAYKWSPKWMQDRMGKDPQRQKKALRRPDDVATHLGVYGDLNAYGLDEPFTREEHAMAAVRTVDKFATSADDNVGPQHLPLSVQEMPLEIQQAVVKSAMRAWNDLSDEDGKLKFTFDHSRKHWALTRPDLSKLGAGNGKAADVVFLDEAQDTPPVLAKVVADQKVQKVIVGDADQAIYGFTGATDYLSQADKDVELPLNKSWRFGPEVADAGNRFLQLLGSKGRVEGGGPSSKLVDGMENADAILTRSNAGMIGEIMRELENGRSVGVPKGTKADLERLFNHADDLMNGRVPRNIHEDLAAFRKWDDFTKEAAKGDDPKLAMIKRLIDDNTIPVLRDTIARVIDPQDSASSSSNGSFAGNAKIDEKTGIITNSFMLNKNLKAKGDSMYGLGYKWNGPSKTWVPRDSSPAGIQKAKEGMKQYIANAEGGNSNVPQTDVTISTAHKAKGLEWGRVRIGDDFKAPERDEDTDEVKMPTPEELRLAYVAVTRAEKELDAGSLGWVYDYTDENGGIPEAPETAQGESPESDSEAPETTEDTPAPVEAPEAPSEPETAPEPTPAPASTAKPKVNRDNGEVTVDGRSIGRIMPSPAGYSVETPDGKTERYSFYPTQKKAAERLVELDARGEGKAPAPKAEETPAPNAPEAPAETPAPKDSGSGLPKFVKGVLAENPDRELKDEYSGEDAKRMFENYQKGYKRSQRENYDLEKLDKEFPNPKDWNAANDGYMDYAVDREFGESWFKPKTTPEPEESAPSTDPKLENRFNEISKEKDTAGPGSVEEQAWDSAHDNARDSENEGVKRESDEWYEIFISSYDSTLNDLRSEENERKRREEEDRISEDEEPVVEEKAPVTETLPTGNIDTADPDIEAKLENAPTGAVIRANHDRGTIFYTKQESGQWQTIVTRGGSRYGEPGKAYGSDVIARTIAKDDRRFNYQFGLPKTSEKPAPTKAPEPETPAPQPKAPEPAPRVETPAPQPEDSTPVSSAPRRGEPGTTHVETLEKATAGRGRKPVRRTYYDENGQGYSDGSFVFNKKTGKTVMVVKGISEGQVRVKDMESGKEFTVLPKFLKSGITQEEQEQDTKTAEAPPMAKSEPKTAESDAELYKGSIGVDSNGKYFVDQEGKKVYKGGKAKFTFKGEELTGEVQTMFPSTGGAVIVLPDGTKKQVRVHKLKGV